MQLRGFLMSDPATPIRNTHTSFLRGVGQRLNSTRLGDLLLASKLITPEQLDRALAKQRQTREPLGKILVHEGALSAVQLYRTLTEQWCLKASAAGLTMMMQVLAPASARAEEPAIARVQLAVSEVAPMQASLSAAARAATSIAPSAAPSFAAPSAALRPQLRRDHGGLFGSTEVRSTDISAFTKWTTVMARFEQQMGAQAASPRMQSWKAGIKRLQGLSDAEKVAGVNDYINAVRYVEDSQNYGKSDYWATPVEFFARGGDCEDYAIAKYASLRALGFRADQMRIAIVQDKIKNIPHALLVVYTDEGSFVLDNQDKRTRLTSDVNRYRPIFSINSGAWWLHKDGGNA